MEAAHVPAFSLNRRIGQTYYTVNIRFSDHATQTMEDKLLHMIRNETVYDNSGNVIREIRIYRKPLSDGKAAYGFFNLSDTAQKVDFRLDSEAVIYDPWQRRGLGRSGELQMNLPRHGARVLIVQ